MIRLVTLISLLTVLPVLGHDGSQSSAGYTVSRTNNGTQLTLHFQRRDYPAHALIAVTAIVRNVSHPHLAVAASFRARGFCNWPVVSLVSVSTGGQAAEPMPPIPFPMPECPAPPIFDLLVGHAYAEHQLTVLWSSRLRVSAQVFNHAGNSFSGFTFQGPTPGFRLHHAKGPTIALTKVGHWTAAIIVPPAGVPGPLYFRSWGACAERRSLIGAAYWTAVRGRVVSSGCQRVKQWHLDVAALNSPVASLNLGAARSSR